MAAYLIDTNILMRVFQEASVHHPEAMRALSLLLGREEDVCITPQVIIELWASATRPLDVNGLGVQPGFLSGYVEGQIEQFRMLDDAPDVFESWLELVRKYDVKGKRAHDARLVAVMKAHRVENLLTFNVDDFKMFEGINTIHPSSVQ
jgi:predicted nucleic acid-binding protein